MLADASKAIFPTWQPRLVSSREVFLAKKRSVTLRLAPTADAAHFLKFAASNPSLLDTPAGKSGRSGRDVGRDGKSGRVLQEGENAGSVGASKETQTRTWMASPGGHWYCQFYARRKMKPPLTSSWGGQEGRWTEAPWAATEGRSRGARSRPKLLQGTSRKFKAHKQNRAQAYR